MSGFPDPFFLLFTDCPQVLCPPERSLASHVKLGRRAWPFAVGFPSCSREGASRAMMASTALRGEPCLSGLSGLSFASLLPHSLCCEDGGLLLCHRLAGPFLPQDFAHPLPGALFSRHLPASPSPWPSIQWRLPGESPGHPGSRDSLSPPSLIFVVSVLHHLTHCVFHSVTCSFPLGRLSVLCVQVFLSALFTADPLQPGMPGMV